MKAVSFLKVKLTWEEDGGAAVSTTGLIDVSGTGGSSRETSEIELLDDTVILETNTEKYDDMSFQLPYNEEDNSFHEVVYASYKANKRGTLSFEFDNMPDGGTNGTKFEGKAALTSYKPEKNSKTLVASFTAKWDREAGEMVRTKAQ